jgi:hypothetical protein
MVNLQYRSSSNPGMPFVLGMRHAHMSPRRLIIRHVSPYRGKRLGDGERLTPLSGTLAVRHLYVDASLPSKRHLGRASIASVVPSKPVIPELKNLNETSRLAKPSLIRGVLNSHVLKGT